MAPQTTSALAVAFGIALAAPNAFSATLPFIQNFDSLDTSGGDVAVPGFTESSTSAYTVIASSIAGDNDYRASISNASGGLSVSSGMSIPELAGNAFTVSTDFTISAFQLPSGGTINLGLGILGSVPNFSTGGQYRILFTLGSPNSGEAGTVNIQENGTTFTSQVRGASIGVALDVPYTLSISATYSGGMIFLTATATRHDTGATTTTTASDATPQMGEYFGYRTALNAVGGAASETVHYDNFTVVPEPTSSLLLLSGVALLSGSMRRRRTAGAR